MNIYRECTDNGAFDKRLAVYFDDYCQNDLGIHKSRIIGETKGNKILFEYAISELFDLVESECYLISMKEHFENEKQDVQKPINEIKQQYEDLFNSYRTQGYIGEKKIYEEI